MIIDLLHWDDAIVKFLEGGLPVTSPVVKCKV